MSLQNNIRVKHIVQAYTYASLQYNQDIACDQDIDVWLHT